MQSTWPLLSLLIWIPIIGGVLVAALGENKATQARLLALLSSLVTFLLSLSLFANFGKNYMSIISTHFNQE